MEGVLASGESDVARGVKSGRRSRESLRFAPSGKVVGFRASGLSAYNNVDPHTVVRELVQNSLDAARKAKREVARVVFEIEDIDVGRIPARGEYREHLQCAIDTQKKKGNFEQSRSIVEAMESSICASRVPVLWVLDNGVGLDDQGMEDLLGDGQSGKADESSAGSYGNGHMTSFPASDLRYVVYGGVHEGGRTVSGHAILASHVSGRKVSGEDGYLARKIRPNDLFDRFDFSDGAQTPLLKEKLDRIEEEFGTGSVVGILGFNGFNRFSSGEEVRDVIETVVARHFTPVIRDGAMEVAIRIAGDDEGRRIEADGLEGILERARDRQRRDRNSIGPSGRQAWETLGTLAPAYRNVIQTRAGKVRFHFRRLSHDSGGGTHVQLFRSGMWITNYVPQNRPSDFRQREPFCGVVLLEPEQAGEACGLVGDFEGPRHIDIDLTRQKPGTKQRKALQEFVGELHAGIERLVPELDLVEHDPGFFSIEVTGDGVRNNPRARPGGTGTPEAVPPRPPGGGGSGGGGGTEPDRPGTLRRQGTRIEARVTALKRTRGMRLRARVLEAAPNAELRVVLADGSDETCDSPEPDSYLEIGAGAKVGGEAVKGYVSDRHGTRRAVLLGPVSPDSGELDIWLPTRPLGDGEVRVEFVRRAARASSS